MIIKVKTPMSVGTLRDQMKGPDHRDVCSQLSVYFQKLAGGMIDGVVEVDYEDDGKVDLKTDSKPVEKKVTKKKVTKK